MILNYDAGALITLASLREYFYGELSEALHNQRISAEDETVQYLTNMLTVFTRSEELFEKTEHGVELRPLALTYCDALNESSVLERTRMMQKLGDTALFIVGVFSQSLNRKLVDVDYYIAMGGNVYSYVCDSVRSYGSVRSLALMFKELTEKFTDFVDVLNEVSERSNISGHSDVLRIYEIWIRTGSKRAEAQLRRFGIEPIKSSKTDFRH